MADSSINMEVSSKVINFSAGPTKIPVEVMQKAQKELLDWNGCGVSVIEMSHRSANFIKILDHAEQLVRQLLNVPSNYKVLFLPGGGVGQFSGVPMNLLGTGVGDYVVTGSWSDKAAKEAQKYGIVNRAVPKVSKYTYVSSVGEWKLTPDAKYVFYCDNETIDGVEFDSVPNIDAVLVCDMSSNIFTRPVDVAKFGLIFAGTQKNAGCSGSTLVIVREDLVGKASAICPSVLDYKLQADNTSLYNTPSCFSIYLTGLVMDWVKEKGGVEVMSELASKKAKTIYDVIDSSENFYYSPVEPRYRSRINISFRIGFPEPSVELEKKFLQEAEKHNMYELKGHRTVGGLRASLYNAHTVEEANALAQFMKGFMVANKI